MANCFDCDVYEKLGVLVFEFNAVIAGSNTISSFRSLSVFGVVLGTLETDFLCGTVIVVMTPPTAYLDKLSLDKLRFLATAINA